MRITEERRKRIEEYRQKNNLTKSDLAYKLGLSRATITRILNGSTTVILDTTAHILAPLLGEDVDQVELEPRKPPKPVIGVTYNGSGMMPYLQPGVRYMAIQEELDLIEDGEIVVTDVPVDTPDGSRRVENIVGIYSRLGDTVTIDRGKAGVVTMWTASVRWIARVLRPVSDVVVDGP